MRNLLIIGHTYPEPSTTAAGCRLMQLIEQLEQFEYNVSFATTAMPSDHSVALQEMGITTYPLRLNDTMFDELLGDLQPSVVLFDRFITEEQFGWRVAETCPNTLRILDTEDLHFLRKAREASYKKGLNIQQADLFTETAKRELASILRCDLSLIISETEYKILDEVFKIPVDLLRYVPFLIPPLQRDEKQISAYDARIDFMTVGNLKHAPNVASVKILKQEIWPKIQQRLPKAKLHVYGAYVPQFVQEMHSPKDNFLIEGWAPDISTLMHTHRVQLAPLPFGAGLKGKIMDAMKYGLPTVMTQLAAEGMYDNVLGLSWVTDDSDKFVAQAISLYKNRDAWERVQEHGFQTLATRFNSAQFVSELDNRIAWLIENLEKHRKSHFMGQILQHHTLQATRYMSKWIEIKEKLN